MKRFTPDHGQAFAITFPEIGDFIIHAVRLDEPTESAAIDSQGWGAAAVYAEILWITGTIPDQIDSPCSDWSPEFLTVGHRLLFDPVDDHWSMLMIRDEFDCQFKPMEVPANA